MTGVSGIGGLIRIAKNLPELVELGQAIQRAGQGDPDAREYLKAQGWRTALDVAVRPGAGEAGARAVQAIKEVFDSNVIDGEFREIGAPAWTGFLRWLKAQKWGCFVILGPKGGGKSYLALRLAQVWHELHDYPVIGVNLYPEDIQGLPWVQRTGIASFGKMMARLTKALEGDDFEEDPEIDRKNIEPISIEPMRRRIVIIDEASLVLHPGGPNSGRATARRAMAQARHLNWLVLYLGQLTRQLPMDLLLTEATFVKKPLGDEHRLDRDEPIVHDLWEDAGNAFKGVRQMPEWSQFPDTRAWAYVECKSPRYKGLMPYSIPGTPLERASGPMDSIREVD